MSGMSTDVVQNCDLRVWLFLRKTNTLQDFVYVKTHELSVKWITDSVSNGGDGGGGDDDDDDDVCL